MEKTNYTPGKWNYACDSYGKVRHSKKACVYTSVKGTGGERSVKVAAQVENWDDARLIAAAKELYLALETMNHMGGDARGGYCICPMKDGSAPQKKHATACQDARYAIAKARGLTYATGELLPDAFSKAAS